MPGNREFFQLRSTTPRMAAGSDEAELMLYGEIVPDYSKWYKENYPEDKSAADFDKAVKQIKQNGARRLNLRINSPGGIVTQAVAFFDVLEICSCKKVLKIRLALLVGFHCGRLRHSTIGKILA